MKLLTIFFLLFGSMMSFAQESKIYTTKSGAIGGYDPVAYFTSNEAVKGKEAFSMEWKGATWFFANEANQAAFEKDPEKYAPQFGGYCAFGVAKGSLYKIDPEAWKIVDEKLYLNYNKGIQKKWEANEAAFISEAETNWPELIK